MRRRPTAHSLNMGTCMDLKVYVLDGGRLVTEDASIFSADGYYKGEHWDMAHPCYLVVHPKGMLIWDCGFVDSLADLPHGYNSGRSIWSLPQKLAQQLNEMGNQEERSVGTACVRT